MKQHLVPVLENRPLWDNVRLLTLHAPELARAIRPGQFALARDPSTFDPYLRRTLWLFETHEQAVSFTINRNDRLAPRLRVGDKLDLLAPLGRAVDLEPSARHILLVGEGEQTAPLVAIAHDAIRRGHEVVLSSFAPHDAQGGSPIPAFLLSPEIEYRTDNGVDKELIKWADTLIASGSIKLYQLIADCMRTTRYRVEPGMARLIIDMPMPCGIGACFACATEISRDVRPICIDGPTIDLVEWEGWRTR